MLVPCALDPLGDLHQGNVFYALSLGHGNNGDTIRRAASSRSLSPDGGAAENLPQGEDVLLYTGTGSILAMTVDAYDDLVFTMVDVPAVSGGVYTLRMAPGGVVRPRDQLPEGEGGRGQGDGTGGGSDGGRGGGGGDAAAPAVALAAHLGPFLPGVAVCPVTGDVYATKGHTGITRLVKGADGGFGRKVRFPQPVNKWKVLRASWCVDSTFFVLSPPVCRPGLIDARATAYFAGRCCPPYHGIEDANQWCDIYSETDDRAGPAAQIRMCEGSPNCGMVSPSPLISVRCV